MKKIKYLALLLFLGVLLNSCGVTYKKESLTQDLEKLVEKEVGQKSKAYVVGKTLYLDMQVEGLNSSDRQAFDKALHKFRISGLGISRVVLSSDSDVEFMVVTACDPTYTFLLRLVQNVEDIKKYFYMRISKSDYDSRSLLEIFGEHSVIKIVADKHDISQEEFVGRLIASKLNTLPESGGAFQYASVKERILFLVLLQQYDIKNAPLIENFLREKFKDYSKKYNNPFDLLEVINLNGTRAISVYLNVE